MFNKNTLHKILSKNWLGNIYLLLISAGIVVFCMWLMTVPQYLHHTQQKQSISSPLICMKEITLHEYINDYYELELTTQESCLDRTQETILCNNVACKILHHGVQIAWAQGKRARMNKTKKTLFLSGGAQGAWNELLFAGDKIHYNFLTNIIWTHQPITYTHPSFTLSAQKSVIDLNKQKIYMNDGVTSEFYIARPPTTAVSDAG